MAERGSMTALVDLVERMVGDPGNEAHSRDEIQAALDVYRLEARYEALSPVMTWAGGVAVYRDFDAGRGYWETSATFWDAGLLPIIPSVTDWMGGRWTFSYEPTRPVAILGWSYDPYLAAADLLEIRAAQVAGDYDFQTGPDSYKRSQRHGQLLKQAALYRAMSPRRKAEVEAAAAAAMTMPEVVLDVFRF